MHMVDRKLMGKVLDNIKCGEKGLKTGLHELDRALGGGFQDGTFYVLGGRPAMGKTALALNIVCKAIETNTKVTYFSIEMSKEKLVERLLYMLAHVSKPRDAWTLNNEDWKSIIAASNKIVEAGLIIDDTQGLSVDEMRDKLLNQPEYNESKLIIVDYLQIMNGHGKKEDKFDSRFLEEDYIARELRKISKDSNIPVLALSQISRACDDIREDHHPILSDIVCRTVEEMADVVLFLYRDEYYDMDTERKNIADIIIEKNKYGSRVHTECVYIPEYSLFANLERG